jgi:hypothetical protein
MLTVVGVSGGITMSVTKASLLSDPKVEFRGRRMISGLFGGTDAAGA